jgi:hypothetical protein
MKELEERKKRRQRRTTDITNPKEHQRNYIKIGMGTHGQHR